MAEQNVSLRDYIDSCMKAEELRLTGFLNLVTQHFELNARAIEKAEEAMRATYITKEDLVMIMESQDKRIKDLELTRAFSAGKLWMAMAGFAAVPTILALIALFTR